MFILQTFYMTIGPFHYYEEANTYGEWYTQGDTFSIAVMTGPVAAAMGDIPTSILWEE